MAIEENKELVRKYPFLMPKKGYEEEVPEDYDFSWTKMDDMPEGWRKAFGDLMLEDISAILKKADYEDKYHIIQIKEKFGELRWYDNGAPDAIYDELYYLIAEYEYISGSTCIKCGKFPAKMRSVHGWISPCCDKCAEKMEGVVTVDQKDFDPEIRFVSYSKTGKVEKLIDCSDIVRRMQEKQNVK